MKKTACWALGLVLFLTAGPLLAKAVTFRNAGLKEETIVVLEVSGKIVSGTFMARPYDEEGRGVSFTGSVVPTPKGKRGVFLEIKFAGASPYQTPPDATKLIWRLTAVNGRAHLFIPMQERSYEGPTPKWVVAEVELEPVSGR
jgi:hypothetical protein